MTPFMIVSGVTDVEQARRLVDAGVVGIGFVFHGDSAVTPETAREIALKLPPLISRIGFFKDEPWYSVAEIATLCRLEVLAFEGEEDTAYLNKFSEHVLKYRPNLSTYGGEEMIITDFAGVKPGINAGSLIVRCKANEEQVREARQVILPYGIEVRLTGREDFPNLINMLK